MIVAVWHFRPEGVEFTGFLAVDFFLILSGFVLTHAYFNRESFSLPRFIWLRWVRMYPLHLITLIFAVIIHHYMDGGIDRNALFLHLFMVHEIGFGPGYATFNGPSWTISVEFWINVMVAVVVATLVSRARLIALAIIMMFFFSILFTQADWLNITSGKLYPGLNAGFVRCAGEFVLGIFVYKLYERFPSIWVPYAGVAAIVSFAIFLSTPILKGQMQFLALPVFATIVKIQARMARSARERKA